MGRLTWAAAVLAMAGHAGAGELVDLQGNCPEVRFGTPRTAVIHPIDPPEDSHLQTGQQLVRVVLPISAVVTSGDPARVEELSIEVNAAEAGLTVHDFEPRTRLETEYAGPIELEKTADDTRQVDLSLGGVLPNPSGGVAQLLPSASLGKGEHQTHRQKATKLAPKEAVVIAGAIAQRQGVLWKFRPSSQRTIEGEHRLRMTLVAPGDWPRPGEPAGLTVACAASGHRKRLFTAHRTTWSEQLATVALLSPAAVRHTASKPAAATARGPVSHRPPPRLRASLWKARVSAGPPATAPPEWDAAGE